MGIRPWIFHSGLFVYLELFLEKRQRKKLWCRLHQDGTMTIALAIKDHITLNRFSSKILIYGCGWGTEGNLKIKCHFLHYNAMFVQMGKPQLPVGQGVEFFPNSHLAVFTESKEKRTLNFRLILFLQKNKYFERKKKD